jgi:hypothetical protein
MIVLALMLVGTRVDAQGAGRWSAEVDGGVALPTSRLAGARLGTGAGPGVNVRYRFRPHLAAYAGWEWHRFAPDAVLGVRDLDAEETGYTFGLRYERPLAGRTGYWLRFGGLIDHIELETQDGALVDDSGHGLGIEVGGGVTIPTGRRTALTPGVRYRSFTRELTVGTTERSARLSYLLFAAGFAFTF